MNCILCGKELEDIEKNAEMNAGLCFICYVGVGSIQEKLELAHRIKADGGRPAPVVEQELVAGSA